MNSTSKIGFAFFLLPFTHSFSQKNITHQEVLWVRYQARIQLDEKNTVVQELDERSFISPWRQHQLVERTSFERKLGKGWKADVGFTVMILSTPQDPEIKDFQNETELRPHLGFGYKQKISEKFSIQHRYRSEFRFLEQANGKIEYSNNRTRYQLALQYQLFPKLNINAFDEIHINIGKKVVQNTFDQNRLGGGILYSPSEKVGLELGYFRWFQQRPSGDQFYSRDIFRFTFHHFIDFSRNKKF